MQQTGVIRILDVFLHQLPVARNALAPVTQNFELAAIEDAVKVFQDGGAEKLLEGLHVMIEGCEHHATPHGHLELGQTMV